MLEVEAIPVPLQYAYISRSPLITVVIPDVDNIWNEVCLDGARELELCYKIWWRDHNGSGVLVLSNWNIRVLLADSACVFNPHGVTKLYEEAHSPLMTYLAAVQTISARCMWKWITCSRCFALCTCFVFWPHRGAFVCWLQCCRTIRNVSCTSCQVIASWTQACVPACNLHIDFCIASWEFSICMR
jgi:hypothetical protein